jgi:hypothetical protein
MCPTLNHQRGEYGPQSMCWRDAVKKLNEIVKSDVKTLKESGYEPITTSDVGECEDRPPVRD